MSNVDGLNRGKDFEEVIKQAFLEVPGTVVERMPDPVQGYLGIKNKCDFYIYHFPYVYYIECKSVNSHRLPFLNITFNQRTGMADAVENFGVVAGIMCWFITEDKTVFLPIQTIVRRRLAGEKSINIRKLPEDEYIEISGRKKRVFFEYNMAEFLTKMQDMRFGERGINE